MTTIELLLSGILPLISGVIFFMLGNIYKKLNDHEERLRKAVSDQDVRILISDKIDPLKEDIHEIKQKLDKLIELREKK